MNGRVIRYVAYWNPTDRASDYGKMISECEKMFNCKFEEKKLNDYSALYSSILAGQPICDIYAPMFDEILSAAAKGMLIPLDTLPSFNLKDKKWNQACNRESTLNGHVYGVTRQLQLRELLIYNKEMFKANNWPDLYELQKKGELTWNVLYDIMSKATKVSGDTVTCYGLVPKYSVATFATVLLNANGVRALSRDNGAQKFTFGLTNNNAALTALSTLNTWASKPGYVYDFTPYGWDTGREVFYSGKAAMAMVDQHHIHTIMAKSNFDFGLVLFPHGPDYNKNLVTYTCNNEAIPVGTKNPDDVALFWDVLMDLRFSGDDFANIRDAAADPSVSATIDEFANRLQNGDYIHDYANVDGGVSLEDYYKQVANGQTTPAAMIASVAQKIDALANDFWK